MTLVQPYAIQMECGGMKILYGSVGPMPSNGAIGEGRRGKVGSFRFIDFEVQITRPVTPVDARRSNASANGIVSDIMHSLRCDPHNIHGWDRIRRKTIVLERIVQADLRCESVVVRVSV
jgi:hypothetical protein